MIYHQKDGGVVRTQPSPATGFVCLYCGTTWTEKLDVWQDCVPYLDVDNDTIVASDIAITTIQAAPVIRDKGLGRVGTVIEKVQGSITEPLTP